MVALYVVGDVQKWNSQSQTAIQNRKVVIKRL